MAKGNSYRRKAPTSVQSFRRKITGSTAPGSAILVVTEGINTEPAYFDAIRSRFAAPTVELVTHGAGKGDPRVLTDAALDFRKKRKNQTRKKKLGINQLEDFDELWIVFDTDVLDLQKLNDGIAYAKSKGVNMAMTEPCFEFWLLLHGLYTTAQMLKCKNVVPYLQKTFGWRSYSKDGKKTSEVRMLIEPLVEKSKVSDAVQHAKRVRTHHKKANTLFPPNPSTQVDFLIEAINAAVSKANKFL